MYALHAAMPLVCQYCQRLCATVLLQLHTCR
jgi:hypothetical protein